ncbi:MAG: hypothetical protein JWO98_2257 [Frankiales bacterium]|nr:hypothetical protein [Frankiales bacterium]
MGFDAPSHVASGDQRLVRTTLGLIHRGRERIGSAVLPTTLREMIGLLVLLFTLPFKLLFLVIKVLAELLEHSGGHRRHPGGHRRRPRGHGGRSRRPSRPQAPGRLFWQIVGVLFVIGLIGAHPLLFAVLAALGVGGFLLFRQQKLRRERNEQQRRDTELATQRAHAELVAALRPEDVEWLRSAGWQEPGERRTDPLAG